MNISPTDTPASVLKKVFGYDSFRPLQEEVIKNVLDKKDTLAIMPTGGGKSICYQLPALLFEGLTVVISPLISLMKDQVDQLNQTGISAVMLNSSLSFNNYIDYCESIKRGEVKLLYIAPESLFKEDICDLLEQVQVDCITIDEAHCISEWGHDFRPEYRQLGSYRKKFPEAACLALTATATPRVQDDIIRSLGFTHKNRFISSFDRSNLFLQVLQKNNPLIQTESFLQAHSGEPGIIYCATRSQVDELTARLKTKGYSVLPYHAGLSDRQREKNQSRFANDDVQIIVATIAFGMGINKSNVRFVVHYDLPKSLESYYQEIGRSGRDGAQADCLLLFGYGDIAKINYFIDQKINENERRVAKLLMHDMVSYAEAKVCRRIPLLHHFGEAPHEQNCGMCDNCTNEETREGLEDITIAAQKFLSCVKRTGEIFGAGHLIDVLRGSYNEKTDKFRHQNLSVFGIGKEYSKEEWLHLIGQFSQNGLISRDLNYGSIKLTAKAGEVLFEGLKIKGTIESRKIAAKKPKKAVVAEYDDALFEELRKMRKKLADKEGVPPYVIFSDKTLMEIAGRVPRSNRELLDISGIGEVKLSRYGQQVLEVINSYNP